MMILGSLAIAAALLPQDPIELRLEPGEALELLAAWEPLTDTVYAFETMDLRFGEPEVAQESALHENEAFAPFLPAEPVRVGDVWRLDPIDALPFLQQLHPGVTDKMHHADPGSGITAEGAWATLRAVSDRYAEIYLRVHADFRLDPIDVQNSAWLTPAQFAGRLVIDVKNHSVVGFELALPDAHANVDVNLFHEEYGNIADIGRVPEMSVIGGDFPGDDVFETVQPGTQARLTLARLAYPIAQLEWLELGDALGRSRTDGRPLHVIVLFGSLLDESC